MSDVLKKPYDSVDLSLLISSFGANIGTLYPVAYVYGPPNNAQIDGSPFTLSTIGNNLYVLNNAFQAKVDSGTYYVVYAVYNDAAHTIKSTIYPETDSRITISIQAVSGVGNAGSEISGFDYEAIGKLQQWNKDLFDKLEVKIDKLKLEVDNNSLKNDFDLKMVKIEGLIKELVFNPETILKPLGEANSLIKHGFKDVIVGLKRNRSVIIKNKFDKSQLLPIVKNAAETQMKVTEELDKFKIAITKTVDLKGDQLIETFSKILEDTLNKFIDILNKLNESMRIKLKFVVDTIKVMTSRQIIQKINVNLKKDDEE